MLLVTFGTLKSLEVLVRRCWSYNSGMRSESTEQTMLECKLMAGFSMLVRVKAQERGRLKSATNTGDL